MKERLETGREEVNSAPFRVEPSTSPCRTKDRQNRRRTIYAEGINKHLKVAIIDKADVKEKIPRWKVLHIVECALKGTAQGTRFAFGASETYCPGLMA